MSFKYKFLSDEKPYFVSFSVVYWMDALTRTEYKEILLDSWRFCRQHKDPDIYACCIMTNHVHMIVGTRGRKMAETIRDMKQFTAKRILKAIGGNPQESRKEWLLRMFEQAGKENGSNWKYQFWLHDNHPIELATPAIMRQKLDYLHNNPVYDRHGIIIPRQRGSSYFMLRFLKKNNQT